MGLLGSLLKLADDIVSIPTDLIGLTNHYGKKKAREILKEAFLNDKITSAEYEKALLEIDSL